MRALERHILLQIIDTRWKEHLAEMDYLREGIHLRGFAQIDPLVAYKNEGYIMFQALMDSIWEEFARLIFHVDVEIEPAAVDDTFGPEDAPADVNYSGGTAADQPSALADARAAAGSGAAATAAARPPPPRERAPRATAPAAPTRRPSSRARTRRSAATTPAGAGAARNTSAATALELTVDRAPQLAGPVTIADPGASGVQVRS